MLKVTRIIQEKTTSTGKPQTIVMVEGHPSEVTYWGHGLKEGQELNAVISLASDPKFKDSIKMLAEAGFTPRASKTADIAKAVELKQKGIEKSMDAKQEGIIRSGSIAYATQMTIAMLEANIIRGKELLDSTDVHKILESEIRYFEELYRKENPPF